MYELIHKPTFTEHFTHLSRGLQQRICKDLKILSRMPNDAANKNIENLGGKRGFWTYRVNDNYRILYQISGKYVQLLDVGKHDFVYGLVDRSRKQKQEHFEALSDVLDPLTPTTAADIPDWPSGTVDYDRPAEAGVAVSQGKSLPMEITGSVLARLQVPPVYHDALIACQTEDDLLSLDLPQDIFDKVSDWLYNQPTLYDIAQEPNYRLNQPEDLERYVEGDLLGFLLLLDPEQKQLVDFALSGPALIKGGPGSGKSTIALYRVAELITRPCLPGTEPRVLFTTYTNALVRASEQLLAQLVGTIPENVEISTLDNIAKRMVDDITGQPQNMVQREDWKAALGSARAAFFRSADQSLQRILDPKVGGFSDDYLQTEIEWMIEGQGLSTLDEYLAIQRIGRQRPLDAAMRRAVWQVYEHICSYFTGNNLVTWNGLRRKALGYLADPRWQEAYGNYDYVLVDEAQDLTPIGLRLCLRLCASPNGLFLTADQGQSLYNKGFSWQKVHSDLKFAGRTRILKRNYRTTRQIAEAAHAFLRGTQAGDDDTLAQHYVHSGPRPRVHGDSSEKSQLEWLYQELHAAMRKLRYDWSAVAILVPKHKLGERITGHFSARGVPIQIVERGQELDLSAPCAKVMTIHSAKGLEFPIVAIPFLNQNELPRWLDPNAHDYGENLLEQRRLFYVACTRAMRRLFVTYDQASPSPFVSELGPLWDAV